MGSRLKNFAIVTGGVVLVLGIIYLAIGFYFRTHFFLHTEINGIEVGGMSLEEAEGVIAANAGEYQLIVRDRDGNAYTLTGKELGARYVSGGGLEEALRQQNMFNWVSPFLVGNRIDVATPMEYDPAMLASAVGNMDLFKPSAIVEPQNATIKLERGDYVVVPEVMGTQLNLERVVAAVGEAVRQGQGGLQLLDEYYENPTVTKDSPQIVNAVEAIQTYLKAEISYPVPGLEETLDRSKIANMIQLGEDYSVSLSESKLREYVQALASKFNTFGRKRSFQTSSGDTIELGGGDYGWVVNRDKEAIALMDIIQAGEVISRQPIWTQTAAVEGRDDLGSTYIEIDYTNQHLWYIVDGSPVMDFEVVTGNLSRGLGSPDGFYKIIYKQRDAVLRGEDYASPVSYFMVFAYNVGIHDASWRSQFGGDIYRTSGSHGCINAPVDKASELFSILEVDTPVVAYYREPVVLTSESARISNAFSFRRAGAD